MADHTVIVTTDGSVRYVHNDDLAEMLQPLGETSIRRASIVEHSTDLPDHMRQAVEAHCREHQIDNKGWWAMILHGPLLGPFASRKLALAAEVEWLNQSLHRLP